MGVGTSGHEDDQLPCRRSRMSSAAADIRAVCWDGRQGVQYGKTAEAKFSQVQVDFDAQCV